MRQPDEGSRPLVGTASTDHDANEVRGQGTSTGVELSPKHAAELVDESSIAPEMVEGRGYTTLTGTEDDLKKLVRLPRWAKTKECFPALLVPIYGPTGELVTYQLKPAHPAVHPKSGKPQKYVSPLRLPNHLDVHPSVVEAVKDPGRRLWVGEGIKKGDALASRGEVVISLTGVFNWRGKLGTLGDWEDVPLKDREVILCFDADAWTKPNVLRAMVRLGRWLKSKHVRKVWYLIVPAEVNGTKVKGADDYLAAGGTVAGLLEAATTREPDADKADDTFTDARLSERVADEVMADRFCWVSGLGWLAWDGRRWESCSDAAVREAIRQWTLERFEQHIHAQRTGNGQAGNTNALDGWRSMLNKGRITAVFDLARGIVERRVAELDADPDLLNTPSGVVDLTTGELLSHAPELLMTKITRGSYLRGARHPDWEAALSALRAPERAWLQVRIGQAITGHPTPDGIMPVLQGSGENGKSALTTDGTVRALGDYASMASPKLFQATKGSEHSTERADLRGRRLVIAEELTEGRSIDVTALKQIQDVTTIKARYIRQDNIEFEASHSLFTTTNYVPVVSEVDHGTWRRLALLRFPFTFRKPGEPLEAATDRRGDVELKARIRAGQDGQHDAIVTWAVDGARRWYANRAGSMALTERIAADTLAWRIEADRILGFWNEYLVPERGACILATEAFDVFTRWLEGNGHIPWPKETFGPRFEQHAETARYRVAKARVLNPKGLSRPLEPWMRQTEVAGKLRIYQGVRWRTGDDAPDPVTREVTEVPDPSDNHSYTREIGEISGGRAPRALGQTGQAPAADRCPECGDEATPSSSGAELLCWSCGWVPVGTAT